MSHETNAALQALIQQLSTLTEKVDAQDKKFDDVFKINGRLLGKIKGTGDTPKTDWDQVQKSVEKFLGRDKDEALEGFRREGEAVQILRSEALDAAKYSAAKQLAAEPRHEKLAGTFSGYRSQPFSPQVHGFLAPSPLPQDFAGVQCQYVGLADCQFHPQSPRQSQHAQKE